MAALWIIIGDINALLNSNDKNKGHVIGTPNDAVFRVFFDFIRGIEFDFVGNPYNCNNGRSDYGVGKDQLDKASYNEAWCITLPQANVIHLVQIQIICLFC